MLGTGLWLQRGLLGAVGASEALPLLTEAAPPVDCPPVQGDRPHILPYPPSHSRAVCASVSPLLPA